MKKDKKEVAKENTPRSDRKLRAVMLTSGEYKRINHTAMGLGLSFSSYMRMVALESLK